MSNDVSAIAKYDAKELKTAEDNVALVWGAQSCPPAVRTQIARLTMAYQLDPFLRHIEILGGRPYITHAGLLHYAMNVKQCLKRIAVRPLTQEEKDSLKGEMKEREIWRHATIEIEMGKFGVVEFTGMAKAGGAGESSSVANGYHCFTIAEKRAINRTLRLALSIAVPSAEEMGAEQFDLPMGDGAPQTSAATVKKDGKESRIEAKLRAVQKPPEGETIPTTATKTEEPPVTSPAEEPAPEEPPQEEAVTSPPADDPMSGERDAKIDSLTSGMASMNQAKQKIFERKILGGRKPSDLSLDELEVVLEALYSSAWAGGQK